MKPFFATVSFVASISSSSENGRVSKPSAFAESLRRRMCSGRRKTAGPDFVW